MNRTFLVTLRLISIVLLSPIVWAATIAFHKYVVALPGSYGDFFFWGMFGFLLIFLFFFQFWGVYEFGQKISAGFFQFTSPANHFFAKIIPFYLTLILVMFHVVKNLLNVDTYDYYFMFFTGFVFTMHILLTVQDLQERERMFIKPGYLFVMSFVLVFMIFITVLLVDLVLGKFTFPVFFQSLWSDALDIYHWVGEKLSFRMPLNG